MSYQPPFTITTEIIDLISVVSEQVGFVQRDFLNASPQLRKVNRIKTITGTLQTTVFITFMLKAIVQTLENAPVNAPQNALVNIEGLKTPDAIIALIKGNAAITRGEMAAAMGKDIRTMGRAIKKLQDQGKLSRVGSDKSGHWVLL